MKNVNPFALLLLILIAVIIVAIITSKPGFQESDAELILPGNTVVIGRCDELRRLSGNWIKVKINGEWYACTDWRLTLKERIVNE